MARVEHPERLFGWSDIYKAAQQFTQFHIVRFAADQPSEYLRLDVKSIQQFERKAISSMWAGHKAALEELVEQAKQRKMVCFYCESPAESQRVSEIVKEINTDIPGNFKLLLGFVHQGFVIDSLDMIVVSHHELFGQFALRRAQRPMRAAAPIDSLSDLQAGDYVVHASYGIGKFLGIETIPLDTDRGGQDKAGKGEYLTIEYADNVKIQVSVQNIALVQKYIGTSPSRPKLSKVGSKRWQKQKEKVAQSVRDLAAELLEVQAKRQATGGFAFGKDSNWQMEFEEAFPYQETPDQITAAEKSKPICRSPSRWTGSCAAMSGTARPSWRCGRRSRPSRTANRWRCLCRRRSCPSSTAGPSPSGSPISPSPSRCSTASRRQNRRRISSSAQSRAKWISLSARIGSSAATWHFKDLGLLIIDEEQRFGVEHKETTQRSCESMWIS